MTVHGHPIRASSSTAAREPPGASLQMGNSRPTRTARIGTHWSCPWSAGLRTHDDGTTPGSLEALADPAGRGPAEASGPSKSDLERG
jgi:hypothetical protein